LCTLSLLRIDVVDAGSSIRLLAVIVALVVAADGDTVGSGYRWSRPWKTKPLDNRDYR
jgi:hypothetical protein